MSKWREHSSAETIAMVEALTENQKRTAAETYSAATLKYQSGHLTYEQARATLDNWPLYFLSWLQTESTV